MGLLIAFFSPSSNKNTSKKNKGLIRRKIVVDRPALILIFSALIAVTIFGWETTKYNTLDNEKTIENNTFVENPYPVYNGKYDLINIIDPTTLDLDSNGKLSRVKLIGTNLFDSGKTTEQNACFSKESSAKLNQYLTGSKIEIESDVSSPIDIDSDILPRYVLVNDENINLKMIAEGFATVTSSSESYRYKAEFITAQENAKKNKLGFWSGSVCPATPATPPVNSAASPSKKPSTPAAATSESDKPSHKPKDDKNTNRDKDKKCEGLPIIGGVVNGLLNRC